MNTAQSRKAYENQVDKDAEHALKKFAARYPLDVRSMFADKLRVPLLEAEVLAIFIGRDEFTPISSDRLSDTRNKAVALAVARGFITHG